MQGTVTMPKIPHLCFKYTAITTYHNLFKQGQQNRWPHILCTGSLRSKEQDLHWYRSSMTTVYGKRGERPLSSDIVPCVTFSLDGTAQAGILPKKGEHLFVFIYLFIYSNIFILEHLVRDNSVLPYRVQSNT